MSHFEIKNRTMKLEKRTITSSDKKWMYQHLDTEEQVNEVRQYLEENSLTIEVSAKLMAEFALDYCIDLELKKSYRSTLEEIRVYRWNPLPLDVPHGFETDDRLLVEETNKYAQEYYRKRKVLSGIQLKRANNWLADYEVHIHDLCRHVKGSFPPSLSDDKDDPALWKTEHWRWFLGKT